MIMPNQIFISYKSVYAAFTEKLHDDLEAYGLDVWLDKRDIKPGEDWQESIGNALESCAIMIAVITPEAVESRIIQAEWNYFLSKDKPVFPIMLKSCEPPFRLQIIQYTDFTQGYEAGFGKLVTALKEKVAELESDSPSPSPKPAAQGDQHAPADWKSFEKSVTQFSNRMLGARYQEKFALEYYFPRSEIHAQFDEFLNSDKFVMTLTGKTGTGKSSFVCYQATTKRADTAVWLQDCAALNLDDVSDISAFIGSSLGLDRYTNVSQLLANLCRDHHRVLFVFDAIDESADPERLLGLLSEFILQLSTPNVKVLLTCRIPDWNTIRASFTVPAHLKFHKSSPNSYINVEIFDEADLEQIYEQYRAFYNISTNFKDLSKQVLQFIVQPIFLKFMCIANQNNAIPETLAVQDVFRHYIAYSIRKDADSSFDATKTQEYFVLERIVTLLFEHKRDEIEVAVLAKDASIGQLVDSDSPNTPYAKLVNECVLSERHEGVRLVSVANDRVFEYLLANIVISPATGEKILQMLDIAKENDFPQLRGAAELALSFAITKRSLSIENFLRLANLNRPEIRQFLSDVIQTIYLNGDRQIASDLIDGLVASNDLSANLVAIQSAYQLRLDHYLVRLALSQKDDIRDNAMLFIYERWNKARLEGHVEDGYRPIELIAAEIRPGKPRGIKPAITVLFNLTLYLLGNMINDREALLPLYKIWQSVAERFSGFYPGPSGNVIDKITQIGLNIIISFLPNVGQEILERGSRIGNKQLQATFWPNPENRRAFMDVGVLRGQPSLAGLKDGVQKLIEWDHVFVPYIAPISLIYHLYDDPDTSMDVLQEIFYTPIKYPYRVRYMVTYLESYATLFRLMRGLPVDPEYIQRGQDHFMEMWDAAHEIDEKSRLPRHEAEESVSGNHFAQSISTIMLAIYHIENFQQLSVGKIVGSEFFERFVQEGFEISDDELKGFIKSLEYIAYQGHANFALSTLLKPQIRRLWEARASDVVIQTIAYMRVFFQEEVDSILNTHEQSGKAILNQVRMMSAIPSLQEVLFPNATFWLLTASIETSLLKGMVALGIDLISVNDSEGLVKRGMQTLLTALFDYDAIDLMILNSYLSHDPQWDRAAELDLNVDLTTLKPEWDRHWQALFSQFISKHGRGIFYGEL